MRLIISNYSDSLPAAMISSMHGDLERGDRLELPWLSGAAVRLAKKHEINMPFNHVVSDVLELYARGLGQKI